MGFIMLFNRRMPFNRCPHPHWRCLAAAGAVAIVSSACSQSSMTALPDLQRPAADSYLSAEQQQKAVQELAQKKAQSEADALKQIQQKR
jgi:hypothetical protein